MHHNKALYKFT